MLLEVAYDGTAFHGWAAQKDVRTVEETLLGALVALDPHVRTVRGASRTDAGVHADGQLAAFDTTRDIPARGWVLGLNQHLPEDVAVRAARPVAAGFAPRFAARGKRYRYRVLVDPVRDPALAARTWRVADVDVAAVAQRGAGRARNARLRRPFARRGTRATTPCGPCRASTSSAKPHPRVVAVVVEGNAFLYNMVRILVGTMIDVGRGRLEPGAIARALRSRDRGQAGTTAPAHGPRPRARRRRTAERKWTAMALTQFLNAPRHRRERGGARVRAADPRRGRGHRRPVARAVGRPSGLGRLSGLARRRCVRASRGPARRRRARPCGPARPRLPRASRRRPRRRPVRSGRGVARAAGVGPARAPPLRGAVAGGRGASARLRRGPRAARRARADRPGARAGRPVRAGRRGPRAQPRARASTARVGFAPVAWSACDRLRRGRPVRCEEPPASWSRGPRGLSTRRPSRGSRGSWPIGAGRPGISASSRCARSTPRS